MKKKNIVKLILLALLLVGFISCDQLSDIQQEEESGGNTETPDENLDRPENELKAAYIRRIEKKYPYFDIAVKSIEVFRTDKSKPIVPLSANDKENFFEYLDAIKLVINSDEFEDSVKAEKYHVFATFQPSATFPEDMIEEYNKLAWTSEYDNDRMVYILRNFSYDLTISRGPQTAIASAGIALLNVRPSHPIVPAYSTNYEREYHRGNGEVEFADDGGAIPKYIPGKNVSFKNAEVVDTLIHEMMHNMGFSHGTPVYIKDPIASTELIANDPSRRIPEIISYLYNRFTYYTNFAEKKKEADDIRGYHEAKYGHLLEK